jgi:hypothetical protein
MDPTSGAVLWVIRQIQRNAEDRVRLGMRDFLIGPPLERALQRPTSDALAAAVRGQLGELATPERVRRAMDVLNGIWTPELVVRSDADTLLDRIRSVIARGIDVASAPVVGLPAEFRTTSSLTALADELGVAFDAAEFGLAFGEAWLRAVRDRALADPVLSDLANLLAHDKTQEMLHQARTDIQASEQRMGQQLRRATQAILEGRRGAQGTASAEREHWFRVHVLPIDQMMHDILRDYGDGFAEAARALRTGLEVDHAMVVLNDFSRRQRASRISVRAMAEVLGEERARSPFDVTVQDTFNDLLPAVRGFIFGADDLLTSSWYSYYIDEFERRMHRGQDPLDRASYAIAGDHDLQTALARVLDMVVDELLPARWEKYVEAFARMRVVCLSGWRT